MAATTRVDGPVRTSIAVGVVFALLVLGHQVAVDSPFLPGVGSVSLLGGLVTTLLFVLPVTFASIATYLLVRERLLAPVATLLVGTPAALVLLRPDGELAFVASVAGLTLAATLTVLEYLLRSLGPVAHIEVSKPTLAAVVAGSAVAFVYTAAFTAFVLLPDWSTPAPLPPVGTPTPASLLAAFVFFFGLYLLLVGVPVGLLVRYRVVLPLLFVLPVLVLDTTVVWTLPAREDVPSALYVIVLPALALALASLGAIEYALRRLTRRFSPRSLF
ncbi:hypothetical protein [Natronorarus salvus]|uniref:hypothetical protein n=1 Tax=Natronorarus salvus TaxID=3117733 RepID=UPI002F26D241